MLILGLESSCDETAAAIVDNWCVRSEVVRSQVDLHCKYGGVVPEIASRAHLEAVDLIVEEVLAGAGLKLSDLDGLAVTQGPGLVGALLVAINFAKGLSLSTGLRITGVNHVKAHALASFLYSSGEKEATLPEFPLVALVVSGGHTSLFLMEDWLTFKILGRTLDDAAGEAFDKTAKLMGLGYPGGRIIEEMAANGNPLAFEITRPMLKEGLNFSFSGLKTRIQTIYRENNLDDVPSGSMELRNLAASFQEAVVEVLVFKLLVAMKQTRAKGAILAGGVAANGALRKAAEAALHKLGSPLYVPRPSWCMDNGAMIASLGSMQLARGENVLGFEAEALPRWPVDN